VSFISIILIPIVGNVEERAGAIIFAFKNKLVGVPAYLVKC
jgi:Ca2+/H+ antiporter